MPDVHPGLVPGRECGACTACCRELTIESDALRKVQGVLCVHCTPEQGCGIYQTRPDACRDWYCQWRRYAWLDDSWRPDRSGLLLRATDDDVPDGFASGIGVVVDVLGGCHRLLPLEAMEVIGALIWAGVAEPVAGGCGAQGRGGCDARPAGGCVSDVGAASEGGDRAVAGRCSLGLRFSYRTIPTAARR